MIIYTDIFSQDELCSDAYKMELIDDVVFKFESKWIEKKKNEEIKVYDGDAFDKKEENQEEKKEDEVEKVNEVVDKFGLNETQFGELKEYQVSLKGYFKKITDNLKEKNPDRVAVFQKGAQKFVGEFFKKNKFSTLQFFVGQSFDNDAMIILGTEDPETKKPYIYLWKDGVRAMKI